MPWSLAKLILAEVENPISNYSIMGAMTLMAECKVIDWRFFVILTVQKAICTFQQMPGVFWASSSQLFSLS